MRPDSNNQICRRRDTHNRNPNNNLRFMSSKARSRDKNQIPP
ncbi:hypothetical protein PLANPX_0312 [Lacipirellula parvula]|uniref:Uncharacterized protein n=1 Tax=Lacipirellula parvula TaxID=2650471 RepID=A0A5K7X2J8_9BACT|nr:hypothetical protein PLANPX_0312 [Lacipirellula parvula]